MRTRFAATRAWALPLLLAAPAAWGNHAQDAIATLKEYGIRYEQWEEEASQKITTSYSASCVRVFAKYYTTFPDWAIGYCGDIDNPHALKAFTKLADDYATLYNWEMRWAAEVHTAEEESAFLEIVSRRHTEKELAQAATLSGWKRAYSLREEREERMRRVTTYESSVQGTLAALPYACRARLSGVTVKLVEPTEGGVLARYEGPALPALLPGECPAPLSGTLILSRPAKKDVDAAELRQAIAREIGCKAPPLAAARARPRAPRRRVYQVARRWESIADLRDAVGSRTKPRNACKVVRPAAPKIVKTSSTKIEEEIRIRTRELRVEITEEMSTRSNAPSKPEAGGAAPAPGGGPSDKGPE